MITSQIIKNNLSSILTEFPNAFIRPCNSHEFVTKPFNMRQEIWAQLTPAERKQYTPEPSHRRKDHSYAHICVTPILEKGKFTKYDTEQFFYVTSSTYFTSEHKTYIAFRQNLIEDWSSMGFCDIMWFPKRASFESSYNGKWAIIRKKQVEQSYISSIKEKTIITFKNDGFMYFAFPILDIELKNQALDMPANTTFNPKFANTFDFIENITYKNSRRSRKGTLYCAILDSKDNNSVIKETSFRSEREAFSVLSTFYGFEYCEKTFDRRIDYEMIQDLIPLYEDYIMFLTYSQEQLEEFKKNPEMFYTKKEERIKINDIELTRTVIEPTDTSYEDEPFYDIIDDIIEFDKNESDDDFSITDTEADKTDNNDIDMTKIQSLRGGVSDYDISEITDNEMFIRRWELERAKLYSSLSEDEVPKDEELLF